MVAWLVVACSSGTSDGPLVRGWIGTTARPLAAYRSAACNRSEGIRTLGAAWRRTGRPRLPRGSLQAPAVPLGDGRLAAGMQCAEPRRPLLVGNPRRGLQDGASKQEVHQGADWQQRHDVAELLAEGGQPPQLTRRQAVHCRPRVAGGFLATRVAAASLPQLGFRPRKPVAAWQGPQPRRTALWGAGLLQCGHPRLDGGHPRLQLGA